jgi:hypothetical protein
MKSNNGKCGECVFVVGELSPIYQGNDEEGSHYSDEFRPQSAFPTIPVFKIQDDWPPTVIEELKLYFAAIWSDPAAATNHLRTTVERLLDHFGVRKSTLAGKSGKKHLVRLSTHARIVAFHQKSPKAAVLFEAVKWWAMRAAMLISERFAR